MEILKVGVVIAAGLGSTWVARETTDAFFGPSPARSLTQAQSSAPEQDAPTPNGDARSAPPAVPEMSREEMEEELRRAQAEIAGKPRAGEPEEFRPSKPLPADLPISLPSDI